MAHPRLVYVSRPIISVKELSEGEIMGHRTRPTAAKDFAPVDLLQGLLVISSFAFWAVMLGLMPVLLFRVWLAS
jgi:hypothetical protein